jgi:biotin carboxyl carrier protein
MVIEPGHLGGDPDALTASTAVVDGSLLLATLARIDPTHAVLQLGPVDGSQPPETHRLLTEPPARTSDGRGAIGQEIVVGGWRVEVEVESEHRARLRERSRRGRDNVGRSGPTEVRAIIPGRIVSLSVAAGDVVTAGQQLLVVEAMKMQNELRAPRDGTVARTVVGPGQNVELGDVLMVIE